MLPLLLHRGKLLPNLHTDVEAKVGDFAIVYLPFTFHRTHPR